MIADPEGWRKWQAEQMAAEPVDYERNLRWFEAALEHARALGAWPPADPMEGFDEKLTYIHRLHALTGAEPYADKLCSNCSQRWRESLTSGKSPIASSGGQAVLIHGEARFTHDIDLTLAVPTGRLPELALAGAVQSRPRSANGGDAPVHPAAPSLRYPSGGGFDCCGPARSG